MPKLKQPEENVNAGPFSWLAFREIIEAIPSHRQQDVRRILSSQANGPGNGGESKNTRPAISIFIEEYRDDQNGKSICLLINCVILCFNNGFFKEAREALRKFVKLNWHSTWRTQYFDEASLSVTNGLETRDPPCLSGTLFNDNLVLIKSSASSRFFVLLNELAIIALSLCELDIAKIIFDHLEETNNTYRSNGQTEIVVVKCNVGCLYATLGQYNKALEYLVEAKTLTNRHGALAAISNNVGWINQKLGSYRKAEFDFKESLDVLQYDGEPTNATYIVTTKYNLARLYKQQGRFKDAMQELRETRALCNYAVPLPLQGVFALDLLSLSLSLSVTEGEEITQLDVFCREICSTMNTDSKSIVDEATATFQEKFAEVCLQRGEINEAKAILLNICQLIQILHGQNHPYLISLLFKLSCVYFIKQEYQRCAETMEKAEKIATETFGASNPKLLPIYSKLAELQFYYFETKDLAKQYVEKIMGILSCLRENGGSLLCNHLDYLKNTGILDSCFKLTVRENCIVLHLFRKKLFEQTKPHIANGQRKDSSADGIAVEPIELSFNCHNNGALVTSLVALTTGLMELGKTDIVVNTLKSGLKLRSVSEGGTLHLLLRSCLFMNQAISNCKDSTNMNDREISNVEKHSSSVAGTTVSKEALQVYGTISKLLQQRHSNHISDHYWFDALGHMIYYASDVISVKNDRIFSDFIVMGSYSHSVAHVPFQVSQQNISVSVVEDDGFQQRFNVIASSVKPVDINDLRTLKKKVSKGIKHTLETTGFAQQGSAVVTINLNVETESIPTLCDELELLPLLVYASMKTRRFANRVTKGVHNVLCKGIMRYQSQGVVPDSFLHNLLITSFKEEQLLGELCDFTEQEKSVTLLSIKPRMALISVSCKQDFIGVKINSLCSQASATSTCGCALNVRNFTNIIEKCSHSFGIQMEQRYAQTLCGRAVDCFTPIQRAGALHHETVVQGKFCTLGDGQQQPDPEFVDADSLCLSVDAHQQPVGKGQSEELRDGKFEGSELSATNCCLTHDEEKGDLQSRMDVSTQTEELGIPPCLEKKPLKLVPDRQHTWLENTESERQARIEFEQGNPIVCQQAVGAAKGDLDGHGLQFRNVTNDTLDQEFFLTNDEETDDYISCEDEQQTSLTTEESEYSFTDVSLRVGVGRRETSSVLSLFEEETASFAEQKKENNQFDSRSSDTNGIQYHIDMLDVPRAKPSGIRVFLQRAIQQGCDDMQRENQQVKEEKANLERLLGEALFERDQAVRRLRMQQELENIRRRQSSIAESGVAVSLTGERQGNEDGRISEVDQRGVGNNLFLVEDVREFEKRPTIDHGADLKISKKNTETKQTNTSSESDSSGEFSNTFGDNKSDCKTRYTLRQITGRNSLIDKSLKTSDDFKKNDAVFKGNNSHGLEQHTAPEMDHQRNQECNNSEAEAYGNSTSLIEVETEEQTDSRIGALIEMSDYSTRNKQDQKLQTNSTEDVALSSDKHSCLKSISVHTVEQSIAVGVKIQNTSSRSEWTGRGEELNVSSKSHRCESIDTSETDTPLNEENSSENDATGRVPVAAATQTLQNITSPLVGTTLTDTKNTQNTETLTTFVDFEDNKSIGQNETRETKDQNERYHADKPDYRATFSAEISNVPILTWNSVESRNQPPNEGVTDAVRSRSVYLEQGARPKQFPSRTISTQRSIEREETFATGSPINDGLNAGFLARHTRDTSIPHFAYHMSGASAMHTLPHENRASAAYVDSESNFGFDNSFVLTARSQTQPIIVPNKGTTSSSDYLSQQMEQPAAYSSFSVYNVDPSYSDILPPPPFIEALPDTHIQSGLTSQVFPSSSMGNWSSGERNSGNNGALTMATYQTNVHDEQDPDKKSERSVKLAESISCEETETETEGVSIADEIEIAELENLSTSSVESFRSEEERVNTLEARVAEACAMVEQVFRERRAREQEIQEREQRQREERERALIERERRQREEQERIARDQEEREKFSDERDRRQENGEGGPEEATAATAGEVPSADDEKYPVQESPQWLCEHYQRRCNLRFPCCNVYHPCHRCHNSSDRCPNESAKAHEATHLQCIVCRSEQPVTESYDTQTCQSCGTKLAEYFCPKCKHFTGVEKKPYHCDKCGICRIHKDKSFHCEVCNVCLDKRLEGKHKCRPDSGHDECCICLEDAFSGCQILPCSHKVHRDCAIAMVRNGIRTCPVCRHPLYSADDQDD